ncbi:hypothetical protein BDF21DRAFT_480264 [Thamnidium elegans]|nr:hypothetical protein BDF21DRAFT_480264 [Thamnidium elegans]
MAPIERELFKNIKLRDDYKLLFSDQHLKLIHAYSFGSRGSSTENLQSHPVQNALFKALDLNGVNLTTLTHNKTANTDILTALNTYLVSFTNMWANNKLTNYLLDKVILVLLRTHLFPKKRNAT